MTDANGVAALDVAIARAYSASAISWSDGPAAIYNRLATELVGHSPAPLRGKVVLDIGAGTGAASYATLKAGSRRVLAVDAAPGMLAVNAARRPPAIVADAAHLPLRSSSFDVALAAFSFNHVLDPASAFAEAARVVGSGGAIVASAYAADDHHPVKSAVENALRAHGWSPPAWHIEMHRESASQLASAASCAEVARSAGLDATISNVRIAFPHVGPRQMIDWRLGMAQHASFVAELTSLQRRQVVRDALLQLGDAPPLVRSMMIIAVRC